MDIMDQTHKIRNLINIVKKNIPNFTFTPNSKKYLSTWDFEMKIIECIRNTKNDKEMQLWSNCIEELYYYCKDDYEYLPRNNRLMTFFKLCLGSTVGKIILQNPIFSSKINKDILLIWMQ